MKLRLPATGLPIVTDCKSCITTHNDMDTVSVLMLHNIVVLTAVKAINRKFPRID